MKKLMLWILAIYSVAHFLYSGVWWAHQGPVAGDMRTAFPGPLSFQAGQRWPALKRDWIVEPSLSTWQMSTRRARTPKAGGDAASLPEAGRSWNYGPSLHFLTLPLMLAKTNVQAFHILLWVYYGLLVVTFFLWMRLLEDGPWRIRDVVILACVWLNFFPLLEILVGKEIEMIELVLITVGLWVLRRQWQIGAGIAFGVAAMAKFLPLIFVPYLWVKGYRKACGVGVMVILAIVVIAQFLLGFEHNVVFEVLMDEASASRISSAYANQALSNVFYKMFTPFNMYEPHPPPTATSFLPVLRVIGLALHAAVLLACGWFLLRWRRTPLLEIECALLAIVMVLVAPHANTYYLVFMLPALSVGVSYWLRHPDSTTLALKIALVGSIVLSGFLVPMKVPELITGVPGVLIARVWQAYSLPAFGAIFAAVAMLELHRIQRNARHVVEAFPAMGILSTVAREGR